jgi:hypothetical protein
MMQAKCSVRLACFDEPTVFAEHIVEGTTMCGKCREFILDRGKYYPDGRLIIFERRPPAYLRVEKIHEQTIERLNTSIPYIAHWAVLNAPICNPSKSISPAHPAHGSGIQFCTECFFKQLNLEVPKDASVTVSFKEEN